MTHTNAQIQQLGELQMAQMGYLNTIAEELGRTQAQGSPLSQGAAETMSTLMASQNRPAEMIALPLRKTMR